MSHRCGTPHCDGTRLGHDLAVEFPVETAQVAEALWRLTHPDDVANPMRDTCGVEETHVHDVLTGEAITEAVARDRSLAETRGAP